MLKRVSPAERLRVQLDEVFAGGQDLARAIEEAARLGAQLLLQTAIEAEVRRVFWRRNRCARRRMSPMPARGRGNGYWLTTARPPGFDYIAASPSRASSTRRRFASELFGKGVTKTNAGRRWRSRGRAADCPPEPKDATEARVNRRRCRARRCTHRTRSRPSFSADGRASTTALDYLIIAGVSGPAKPPPSGAVRKGLRHRRHDRYVRLEAHLPERRAGTDSHPGWEKREAASPLLVSPTTSAGLVSADQERPWVALR